MTVRQDIITWYTPEEKLPPAGKEVVVTISDRSEYPAYDHVFSLAIWGAVGWELTESNDIIDEFIVHAWCDLEPYGG